MEDGGRSTQWRFAAPNPTLAAAGERSIQKALLQVHACLDERGPRPVIALSHGDPSSAPSFRTAPEAEEALVAAVRSGEYNGYPTPATGLPARRAVAEYLSRDLPYMISHDDIFLTCGGSQAIETVMSVFGQAGVNILLPMPGYPKHEAHAVFHRTEVRHYGLLPERGWEVDLEAVEALADGNTVAVVITNPNNPCGSVYTYEHLAKIADMASKLGILVIADEVYGHLVYGTTPFVPMGVFGETVPVITLGAISKRWAVPGWRLGWIATCDPKGILRKTKVADSLRSFISIISGPATFLQGAIPHIIKNTNDEFYNNIVKLLKETAEICYDAIDEIKCITCPHKPEGSFFMMVKLDVSQLSDIRDDVDFCSKLAKEESVILLPGKSLGMENWLRTTFASEPPTLKQGLDRVKSFCRRHQSQAN
ncbi:nicotianamine aminotransferase 1-like isoform X2 [Triticum urartu]|uniref:nicotianamine aminotransferase n=1 Tax=Triticum urartu TaxID=4572 RepID=A0A8R7V4A9_TRIUA|nr:nicotianamine aminotransferase 1-like isoform X2 [Triticum urartu]